MERIDGRQRDAEDRLRRGERIQVQVSPAVAEAVIARATRERRTVSATMRLIVEEWAEREGLASRATSGT